MTLEEAIEHAKEVARTCDDKDCAADHLQLAEWLSLLKVYTDTGMAKEVQRARHEMHGWQLEWKREMERRKELENENDKLRELVRDVWRSCPVDEDDCKKCPHYIVESDEVLCDIPILMREMGIEAEDA